MVRCEGLSHTQGVFVLKTETGGNLGICGSSHIDCRNAFEAFSSSLWMHFISSGTATDRTRSSGRGDRCWEQNGVGMQARRWRPSAAERK